MQVHYNAKTCGYVQELLPAYIEEDLPEAERAAVCEHLQDCRYCSARLSRLGSAWQALDTWEERKPSADSLARLMNRLGEELGDEIPDDETPAATDHISRTRTVLAWAASLAVVTSLAWVFYITPSFNHVVKGAPPEDSVDMMPETVPVTATVEATATPYHHLEVKGDRVIDDALLESSVLGKDEDEEEREKQEAKANNDALDERL